MPLMLAEPKTTTSIISSIMITEIINSPAREMVIIKYNNILSSGEVASSEVLKITGKQAVQELYNELDVLLSRGRGFEEASKELLYGKINTGIIR